jgi:hypothetical protein
MPQKLPAIIRPRIIKLCYRELTPTLTKIINNILTQCIFPSGLKKAEVIPLYKKKYHLLKKNYRPVSILPTFLKYFNTNFHSRRKNTAPIRISISEEMWQSKCLIKAALNARIYIIIDIIQ